MNERAVNEVNSAEKRARGDVLKRISECSRLIPRGGIFELEGWSSFVCPLTKEPGSETLCGEAKDFDVVLRHLNQFSSAEGFTIIKNGSVKNSALLYTCECAGKYKLPKKDVFKAEVHTKKSECRWSIRVRRIETPEIFDGELIEAGMHILKYPDEDHNHELKVRLFVDMASSADLKYSEEDEKHFWQSATELYRQKLEQSRAHTFLYNHSPTFRKIIEANKLTATRLYAKIRAEEGSKTPPSTACQDFIKFLLSHQQDHDVEFFVSFIQDPITNALIGVIWATGEMRKWGKLFTELVIFDTTHDTNIFQFYLGVWGVEDSHGETLITGVCLLAHQDTEMFQWAFEQYDIMIGAKPAAYMTDGDAAIAQALVKCGIVCHLLCIWHLRIISAMA
jgi:hypothetical protein